MTFSEILSLAPAFSEYTTQIPAELDGQFVLETFPPYGLIHQKDSPLRRSHHSFAATQCSRHKNHSTFHSSRNNSDPFLYREEVRYHCQGCGFLTIPHRHRAYSHS